MEKNLRDIKKLLLIIIVPFVLYLLSVLSIIFIPLFFALFAALLFMPLMRWFQRRSIPNVLGIVVVIIFIAGGLKIGSEVVKLSSREIANSNKDFYEKFDRKLNDVIEPLMDWTGVHPVEGQSNLEALLNSERFSEGLFGNVSNTLNFTRKFISMLLMTIFFTILLLAGSLNMQKVMELLIFKQRYSSIKTFRQIEKDILKFIIVKFAMSLFTGVGFGLACYFFGVSFPFFWGLFAFLINFVQMVGSIISVIVLLAFALVELDQTGSLLGFVLVIAGIQVLFGAILEPILMGKSFAINTVTVLIMLALWGFIWGIPGLVLAIPITALIKKIMEQFPQTAVYARIMGQEA
ncbi:MAG: AI-2E family transporter [Crocinitomicaceae bacterium]|nr:AI-2E family transporter [Crocinitomicaceae bacterium]